MARNLGRFPLAPHLAYPARSAETVARLLGHYSAASPATREAGRTWYPIAYAEVCDLAESCDLPYHAVAGIMAAYSVRQQWQVNRANVRAAVSGNLPRGLADTRRKAGAILAGADPAAVLGRKTSCFYRAIMGDADAVTLDVWALLAAGWIPPREDATPTDRVYAAIQDCYAVAAETVGETPRDMQATVWCQVRGRAA